MFEIIRANRRRAVVLLVIFVALFIALGYALGLLFIHNPIAGVILALVVWLFMVWVSWSSGDSMILAASGAHRIQKADHPTLYDVVEEMAIAAGLKTIPEVYVIDVDAPNAFATGRDPEHAKIAVTAGLLERMDRDELEGVIGHEIGHIANHDILYMLFAVTLLGTIVMLADFGASALWFGEVGVGQRRTSAGGNGGQAQAIMLVVAIALMILAPIFAQLLYFALSRRREYLADASSAKFTRYPEGLARALEKIAGNRQALPNANRATAALYIANPLKAKGQELTDLTSTHPPISRRIAILRGMSDHADFSSYDQAFRKVLKKKKGVFSSSTADGSSPVKLREGRRDPRSRAHRVREIGDALWRSRGYKFVSCLCGTTIKVPPDFKDTHISCPNCGRHHELASSN